MRAKEKFTRNLKRIRAQKGITQTELSTLIGTSVRYISLLENKPQNITLDLMESIARALGVPVERFLEPFSMTHTGAAPLFFTPQEVEGIRIRVKKTIDALQNLIEEFDEYHGNETEKNSR